MRRGYPLLLSAALLAIPVTIVTAQETGEKPRVSRLQGRAYVDRNLDVTGATVTVRAVADASRLYLTSTDGRGQFRIEGLPDGEYTVHLDREGFVPVTKDEVKLRFPFRAVVEIRMEPADHRPAVSDAQPAMNAGDSTQTRRVRGRVFESSGQAKGEIYMRLIHHDGQQDPRYLRSGADGSFEATKLLPGRWRLHVHGVGYLPIRAELDLERDLDVLVYLVPQPTNYEPSPLDLMLPEQPLPPAGLAPGDTTRKPS